MPEKNTHHPEKCTGLFSDAAVIQPSATELLQSPLHECGTLLPQNITSAPLLAVFRKHLKTRPSFP